jgi:glycosyltransferase involved in cell wall biosynthesis
MRGEKLHVVMPVYNEVEAITGVLEDWVKALDASGANFIIHAYNDGSKDGTDKSLAAVAAREPRVQVCNKANSGHGPTILKGYRENVGSDWIFQVDSDNEMKADSFLKLWSQRDRYDFLIGRRENRLSPLPRRVISLVSRMVVQFVFGRGVWDVNSPYRLMRTQSFRELFQKIPADTFAPNLIVSGHACRYSLRILEIPVPHVPRSTGEVSIKKWKLIKAASKAFLQTIQFGFSTMSWLAGATAGASNDLKESV